VTTNRPMLPAPKHDVYLLPEVLQYSRTSTARLLKTSAVDMDQLLEHAMRRIRRTSLAPGEPMGMISSPRLDFSNLKTPKRRRLAA
jgi:hypothetical protein